MSEKLTDTVIGAVYTDPDSCEALSAENMYRLVLVENGTVVFRSNGTVVTAAAPCVIALHDAIKAELLARHMLSARSIAFEPSFLNMNITADDISSGKYAGTEKEYGFIAMNAFRRNEPSFYGVLPLSADDLNRYAELFTAFGKNIGSSSGSRAQSAARMQLLMALQLTEHLYAELTSGEFALYKRKDPTVWVNVILDKIHANYSRNISLITLATEVKVNKTTVSQQFHARTGSPVTDYIVGYRIDLATKILSMTRVLVGDVAEALGFNSEAYFVKQFRKRMNNTPARYRRQMAAKRLSAFGCDDCISDGE